MVPPNGALLQTHKRQYIIYSNINIRKKVFPHNIKNSNQSLRDDTGERPAECLMTGMPKRR